MPWTDISIPVAPLEERRPANICLIYTNRDSRMRYSIPHSFYGTQLRDPPRKEITERSRDVRVTLAKQDFKFNSYTHHTFFDWSRHSS